MAKTNFLLYKDFESTLDLLNEEQAGKLFKALYRYVNGRNEPDFKGDGMLVVSFNILKTQLERDLLKYQDKVKVSRDNGKKGGRPSNKGIETQSVIVKPKKPSGLFENPTKGKKGDSVSVSESVSDRVSDKKEYFKDSKLNELFYDYLAMRKVIKKPATKKAIDLAINKIKKLNYDEQISMLENSILNNYQGLFLPNNQKDSKPNRQDIKDIKDTYITHIPDSEANNGPFKVGKN